jgi:hypothetical protein
MSQGLPPIFRLAAKIPLEERLVIIELERKFKETNDGETLKELFKLAGKYLEETNLDFNCPGCRERIFLNWNKIVYHWTNP